MMENNFGNNITRYLNSVTNNPDLFKHVTLLIDDHHNKISYENISMDKKDLYSWKLNSEGFNTQFVIDVNDIAVHISDSLPCKFNNDDDNMFVSNLNLNKFMHLTDCIMFDGLYENTLNEVIAKYQNIGFNITVNNFCFPIKKEKNIDLLKNETLFNQQLGGFRSRIETYFSSLSSLFKRMNPQHKIRITNDRTYNVQLKLCCLLLNIKKFGNICKEYIEITNYHNLWMETDFDFFDVENSNNILEDIDQCENVIEKTKYHLQNINNMRQLQREMLINIINRKDINFKNDRKNKIKTDKDNNEDNDIEMNENNHEYEIQYILKHRGEENNIEYLVKWRGYKKKDNSWVKEYEFNQKEIIDSYWKSIKINNK